MMASFYEKIKFFGQTGVGKQCRSNLQEQSDPGLYSLSFSLHLFEHVKQYCEIY